MFADLQDSIPGGKPKLQGADIEEEAKLQGAYLSVQPISKVQTWMKKPISQGAR